MDSLNGLHRFLGAGDPEDLEPGWAGDVWWPAIRQPFDRQRLSQGLQTVWYRTRPDNRAGWDFTALFGQWIGAPACSFGLVRGVDRPDQVCRRRLRDGQGWLAGIGPHCSERRLLSGVAAGVQQDEQEEGGMASAARRGMRRNGAPTTAWRLADSGARSPADTAGLSRRRGGVGG
ncbi:MAG: hypothetical protein JW797_05345 [Bradymonadales bacterium]|nr:hypothetical protein [Bradymonadales bacterium]